MGKSEGTGRTIRGKGENCHGTEPLEEGCSGLYHCGAAGGRGRTPMRELRPPGRRDTGVAVSGCAGEAGRAGASPLIPPGGSLSPRPVSPGFGAGGGGGAQRSPSCAGVEATRPAWRWRGLGRALSGEMGQILPELGLASTAVTPRAEGWGAAVPTAAGGREGGRVGGGGFSRYRLLFVKESGQPARTRVGFKYLLKATQIAANLYFFPR